MRAVGDGCGSSSGRGSIHASQRWKVGYKGAVARAISLGVSYVSRETSVGRSENRSFRFWCPPDTLVYCSSTWWIQRRARRA